MGISEKMEMKKVGTGRGLLITAACSLGALRRALGAAEFCRWENRIENLRS